MNATRPSDPHEESVRRFFTRLRWQSRSPTAMLNYNELDVESYFFGLQQPPSLINPQRKQSAKGRQTLNDMFSGFRWE